MVFLRAAAGEAAIEVGICEFAPGAAGQHLAGAEAGLVGHLAALRHPVAEIDIGQVERAGAFHQPEDGEGAEGALLQPRGEEAVDGGKPVAELVGEAAADQAVARVAVFDHHRLDRRVLHHGAVVVEAHRGHVAIGVAGLLVALKQVELFGGGAGRHLEPLHRGVGAGDAAQRAVGLEGGDGDADGHAGIAAGADRGVGDVVAAAEAGAGEAVMHLFGLGAGDLGDHLALGAALHIGAGQGGGGVEELRAAWGFEAHAGGNPPAPMIPKRTRSVNVFVRTTTRPETRSWMVRRRVVSRATPSQIAPAATVM